VKKGDLKDYDGIVFGADMMFQNASTVEGGGLTARTGGHLIKYCDDGKCDSDSIYQEYIDRMFPKPYSGDAHCVAVIMEKKSMGMSASVSYAAYFIEVGNSKGASKDKVIEQARQYVRTNYGSSNGYKESQVLVEYNDCKNFKKTIMSQVKLSDFRVDYIKYKE
jgi:dimeric dUTPase (all-alpha-NTP-PPase superfamily)